MTDIELLESGRQYTSKEITTIIFKAYDNVPVGTAPYLAVFDFADWLPAATEQAHWEQYANQQKIEVGDEIYIPWSIVEQLQQTTIAATLIARRINQRRLTVPDYDYHYDRVELAHSILADTYKNEGKKDFLNSSTEIFIALRDTLHRNQTSADTNP